MTEKAAAGAQGDTKAPAGTDTKPDAAAAAAAAGTGKTAADAGAATSEAGKTAEAAGTPGKEADTGSKADEGKGPQSKAPETYALNVPEGGAAHVADDDLKFIEEVARANDWTQEEAQAELQAAVTRAQARDKARADKLIASLKADVDYGGDQLAETQRIARATVDRICPTGHKYREQFLELMNNPLVGNHPAVVAVLADLGKSLGEDSTTHARSTHAGTGGGAASKLYDHPTSRTLDAST